MGSLVRRFFGPAALYAGVLILTYWRLVAPGGQRRVFGWDCLEEYWPNLAYLAGALRNLELPLWNPYDRMGLPFFADPQTGAYHPLTWALAALGALVGVPPALMSWKVVAHLWAGALGMHLYARSLGAPRWGAVLAGLAFSLLGGIAFMKDSAIAWPWQFVPLGLYAIDACLRRPGAARGALCGGAIALAGLAGSPPGFFYSLLVLASYAAFRVATLERPRPWRALAAAGGAAAAVTAALCAIVYVPTAELIARSADRAARDLAWATSLPLPLEDLAGLVVPGIRDPPAAIYPGFLVLLLGAVAIACPSPGRVARYFAALAVATVLLSLGEAGGVLDRLAALVPGFGLFRVAERYKLLLGVATAALAALGARALGEEACAGAAARAAWRGAVVVLAVLGVALLVGYRVRPTWPPGVAKALLMGAIATALFVALARSRRPGRGLCVAAALALVVDAWSAHRALYEVYEPVPALARDRELVPRLAGVERSYRVLDEFQLEFRPGSRLRIREATGYGAMPLRRWKDVLERAGKEPGLLRHYNVRWILRGPHHRRGLAEHALKTPEAGGAYVAQPGGKVLEASAVAPAVYWVGAPRLAAAGADVLALVAAAPPGAAAVVAEADVTAETRVRMAALRTELPPAAGRVLALGANHLSAEIDAPASGLVVVNEVAYPGWRARVDGRPAEVLTVNHLVRGVLVEPGPHRIELEFRPPALYLLGPLYLAALLAVLAAAAVELRRWRSRTRSTSASIGAA